MLLFSKKYSFGLLLLGILFLGVPHTVRAYSITCPGSGYVVVSFTKNGETTAQPNFDPLNGNEYCVKGSLGGVVMFKELEDTHVFSVLDESKNTTVEHRECTTSLTGGVDLYDWDNEVTTGNTGLAYKLVANSDKGVFSPYASYGCGFPVRVRYSMAGWYMYVLDSYTTAPTTVDPAKLVAYCKSLSKEKCDVDTANCTYTESLCYPKAVGDAKKQAAIKADGAPAPGEHADCESINEEPYCKKPEPKCQTNCQTQAGCVWYDSSCRTFAKMSSDEKQAFASASAQDYLTKKYKKPEGYLSNIIPECGFSGTCRSINDLVILLINVAKFLFTIIGSLAFVMFVYGGFTMVLSMGNPEKVKQGRNALGAAVMGIVVAFSAYLLVNVVLNTLNVSGNFRGVNSQVGPKP